MDYDQDKDKVNKLKNGEHVEIKFPYNPTVPPQYRMEVTGNSCAYDRTNYQEGGFMMKHFKNYYENDQNRKGMVGVGGQQIVTFQAPPSIEQFRGKSCYLEFGIEG